MLQQNKCRADLKYDESQSKGKIKRLLASVVTALKDLRLDFVVRNSNRVNLIYKPFQHTRRVECGHKQQVIKITKLMLKLDDKEIS